jgi:hypothetical protein
MDDMPTLATIARPRPESLNFRARALECRAIATRLRVDLARNQMLKTADDFERIAYDEREREIVHGMAQLGALVRKVHEAG